MKNGVWVFPLLNLSVVAFPRSDLQFYLCLFDSITFRPNKLATPIYPTRERS